MSTRSFLLSALIGGAVMAVLGNLPAFNVLNCILCIYAWLGGALAVYMYRRYEHGQLSLSLGQAAGLGATTGIFGALIGVVAYLIMGSIANPILTRVLGLVLGSGGLPFETGGSLIGGAITFFAIDAVLYTLFSALSAMLTVTLMKRQTTAPA